MLSTSAPLQLRLVRQRRLKQIRLQQVAVVVVAVVGVPSPNAHPPTHLVSMAKKAAPNTASAAPASPSNALAHEAGLPFPLSVGAAAAAAVGEACVLVAVPVELTAVAAAVCMEGPVLDVVDVTVCGSGGANTSWCKPVAATSAASAPQWPS